jgi:hypothetical protein
MSRCPALRPQRLVAPAAAPVFHARPASPLLFPTLCYDARRACRFGCGLQLRFSPPARRVAACADVANTSVPAAALRRCGCAQASFTPLLLAVKSGHVECVKLLVERGADKEAKDEVRCAAHPPANVCCTGTVTSAQRCALHRRGGKRAPWAQRAGNAFGVCPSAACRSLSTSALRLRCAHAACGLRVTALCQRRRPPLLQCAASDSADTALSHAALRRCECVQDDVTPMHYAVSYDLVPCVTLLLGRGANKDAKDNVRARAPPPPALSLPTLGHDDGACACRLGCGLRGVRQLLPPASCDVRIDALTLSTIPPAFHPCCPALHSMATRRCTLLRTLATSSALCC